LGKPLAYTNLYFPSKGFMPPDKCNSQSTNITFGTVHRIFDITCDALLDLPDKKAFLRQYNQNFLIGSRATFDCLAGYKFPDGVSFTATILKSNTYCKNIKLQTFFGACFENAVKKLKNNGMQVKDDLRLGHKLMFPFCCRIKEI
jgi:hypothetical protein